MSYNGKYKDIIDLPNHRSKVHAHMSMKDRAAQFSPFAALTGHSDAIDETARITDRKIELSDDEKYILDRKISYIFNNICDEPKCKITYFVPDIYKQGGSYSSYTGNVIKTDSFNGLICFKDKKTIEINQIINIEILEN